LRSYRRPEISRASVRRLLHAAVEGIAQLIGIVGNLPAVDMACRSLPRRGRRRPRCRPAIIVYMFAIAARHALARRLERRARQALARVEPVHGIVFFGASVLYCNSASVGAIVFFYYQLFSTTKSAPASTHNCFRRKRTRTGRRASRSSYEEAPK